MILVLPTVTIFLYVLLGFLVSIAIKRNDIADVMWGPGIFLGILTAAYQFNFPTHSYFFLGLIGIWALRIFFHIGARFIAKNEEDFRYKTWRETWSFFYLRSFLQVFLLQGFLMLSMSTLVIFFLSNEYTFNPFFLTIGTLICLVGLYFETLGDWQLKKFLEDRKLGKEKQQFMKSGLWAKTRHPNYFGEVTFWWGLWVATLPNLNPLLVLTPILITFLILKVSGIPMLEKKNRGIPEWEKYQAETPAFFPKFF